MNKHERKSLKQAIKAARQVQDYLWGNVNEAWSIEEWKRMLRKRVVKLEEVDRANPHALVEVKKRMLQVAAVSIAFMGILEKLKRVPWDATKDIPSNLPQFNKKLK